jgi:hypothetical protein
MRKGGEAGLPALVEGGCGKGRIAVPPKSEQQGMVRVPCLEDDHPGALRPAGPASDLHDHLGHALGRAEICTVQPLVQVQDTHQSNAGKVVPFGQHLGTEQEWDLPALGRAEQALQLAFAAGAVAVDPCHSDIWK